MLGLTIVSFIIGLIVGVASKIAILGLVAGVFIFLCGLPFTLIASFVCGTIDYVQDRNDYRQLCSDIAADEIAEAHEFYEDLRNDRLVDAMTQSPRQVINDNRKQSIYLQGRV